MGVVVLVSFVLLVIGVGVTVAVWLTSTSFPGEGQYH
jgi:hypothetical protein